MRVSTRFVRGAGAVLVLLFALAGCGGEGSAASETTEPTRAPSTSESTTTTIDPTAEREAAAENALLAYWDAYSDAISEPVDPQHPELQALMTGDQKIVVTRNLEEMRARGEAGRTPEGAPQFNFVESVELTDEGAVITACAIDGGEMYVVATGEVVNDDVMTLRYSVDMVEESGSWRISLLTWVAKEEGEGQCGNS